jgi:ribosome-binding factor A
MHQRSPSRNRLQADIHRLLTTLLQREVNDPRLQGVTITGIEMKPGQRTALVKVHRMNEADTKDCIERLNRLAPHFDHELRRALPRKRLPGIRFRWDDAFEAGSAVIDILNRLERP